MFNREKVETGLINKAVQWATKTCAEVRNAGGTPEVIMEKISPDLMNHLVRNNLMIVYVAPKEGEE